MKKISNKHEKNLQRPSVGMAKDEKFERKNWPRNSTVSG